jgi:hypothetical protein
VEEREEEEADGNFEFQENGQIVHKYRAKQALESSPPVEGTTQQPQMLSTGHTEKNENLRKDSSSEEEVEEEAKAVNKKLLGPKMDLNTDLNGDLAYEGANLYGQISMFDAITDQFDQDDEGEGEDEERPYRKRRKQKELDDPGEDADSSKKGLNDDIQSLIVDDAGEGDGD